VGESDRPPEEAAVLWRVRTTLPDRPGSLARLARACGEADVNILGLQIFPGVEAVTDELVLRTPRGWGRPALAELVEAAGGRDVSAVPCTEAALADQPTRYVQAARAVLAQPAAFPEVAAVLFDAEADPRGGPLAEVQDVLDMSVGEVQVQVRRTAPFTATEHARASAMAGLVSDVLARGRLEAAAVPSPGRRLGPGDAPTYRHEQDGVHAVVRGTVVGSATLGPHADEGPAVHRVTLGVDPAWRRRGIGTRLLVDVARLAAGRSVEEVVVVTTADNQAVLPVVLAAGLRGRIRMAGESLTVRIPVHSLTPLEA
jgi:GNAT superfamily N-acetyltransferase